MLADIKHEIEEIESKRNSIDSTLEKMKDWKGKPIYKTCEDKIIKWQIDIDQHLSNIDYWYGELKK